jgi:hypothetical protein
MPFAESSLCTLPFASRLSKDFFNHRHFKAELGKQPRSIDWQLLPPGWYRKRLRIVWHKLSWILLDSAWKNSEPG